MNTKLAALASALVATAALASAAEAGGGVRLGFGVPLGTFTATPAHGGSYRAPRIKKKLPVLQAARKPERPARIAKTETTVAPKAAAETTGAATEDTPRVTGSSALIQGAIPAEEPTGETPPESPAPDVKAEVQPADSEPTVTASADRAPDESDRCKKFIPAVGMTVSVGCDK